MKFTAVAIFSLFAVFPHESSAHIGIAGSANLDTFLPISHLPQAGENLTLLPNMHPSLDVPGGKGCNQAIAARKLSNQKVSFLGRIGNDAGGEIISKVLNEYQVNIQHLQQCPNLPTGRGYVFLEAKTGRVSAVVSGGSNMYGWESFRSKTAKELDVLLEEMLLCENDQVQRSRCLLLQREVPEFVNLMLAERAHHHGITVLQDIGGEERDMSNEMMSYCDYIMPNLTELRRLVKSFDETAVEVDPTDHDSIVKCAKILQKNGARNVLVTLGEQGSLLVMNDGNIIFQEPCDFDQGVQIVDETGAGDCYRAGFAVALSENNGVIDASSIQECMRFASGAGALACLKEGAVPSIPTRDEVKAFIEKNLAKSVSSIPRGGGGNENFPYMFGSRLNSMKDRPELWPNPVDNVKEWVKRQGAVKGLGCVDFNYPQHFQSWTSKDAKKVLDEVGLVAGAVCLRYPSKFARGAMNHPDEALRREAIQLTKEAAVVAKELGCDEVVIWSAFDGYDYPFQVKYKEKWDQLVNAFQECCDAFPYIKWSLEFKPTDENTRFFTVPSTGAALLLVKDIDRPNMGLTLDVGHMLMAGENPGQSIAMVGDKLFGIQLNDGYTRLAAEDGMMFGSVHPNMALEIMYQLQAIKFAGHFYFDTFPQRTDPVAEAEYNIERAKGFYWAAESMNEENLKEIMDQHDAIGAVKAVDDAMRNM